MKKLLILFLFLAPVQIFAQQKVLNIYDGPAPGSENWKWNEAYLEKNAWNTPAVYNVSKPTLTVFEPETGKANGTAVIIAPGGAFMALSIENEGTRVAEYLAKKGVTAFVLKYRLIQAETDDPLKELNDMWGKPEFQRKTAEVLPLASADGKAAIAYVRRHAKELGVATNRIGIMGFSAGGYVTASTAFNSTPENRPDFIAPIYAFMPTNQMGKVDKQSPDAFIVAATNDGLQLASHSLGLYNKWLEAGASAELHMYSAGDHGFGMRKQNLPSDGWIDRFSEWLEHKGYLKPYDFALDAFERKTFTDAEGNVLPYRLLYPENYDASKKYPVLLFLHGAGERGSDNEAQLTHGAKLFLKPGNRSSFPAIVVFPQCPAGNSWSSALTRVNRQTGERIFDYNTPPSWPLTSAASIVQDLVKQGIADPKRISISGLSMGGFGTFEMVYRYPQLFAAAAPICGGGDVNAYDKRVSKIPFWIFHGSEDAVVKPEFSRDMVAKLKQLKAEVRYTEYPGVNHNSWDNAFAEPDYLQWLFGKTKK